MKRSPTKHHGPYDETNPYNFTFQYPLEVGQEGSTSPCALGVVVDSSRVGQANMGVSADGRHSNGHDYGSPDKGKAEAPVKGQQHQDSVS